MNSVPLYYKWLIGIGFLILFVFGVTRINIAQPTVDDDPVDFDIEASESSNHEPNSKSGPSKERTKGMNSIGLLSDTNPKD